MIYTRTIPRIALLCMLAFALASCTEANPAPKNPIVKSDVQSRPEKTIPQLGAEMQQAGIMSQKDYVRIVNLGHEISRTHNISDEDFAWTLSLLKTAHNWLPRARAMTVLAYIHPMSPAQKAKVTSAIAPYINSSDPVDAAYARTLQKSTQRN